MKTRHIKAHSLIGRIDERLMHNAFKAVKRNRGTAKVDKGSIQLFQDHLAENLAALMRDLKSGHFHPSPLQRVFIPNTIEPSAFQPHGISVVKDRIAQEILRKLLDRVFAPGFHATSYGFIAGRNAHMAMEHVLAFHAQGFHVVLLAAINAVFDTLLPQVVMDAVRKRVADGKVLDLLERFLACGVLQDGRHLEITRGTPEGEGISPLLTNIVLDRFDWQLDTLGLRFVRYADHVIVLCQSQPHAEAAQHQVTDILRSLGLALSPDTTRIASYDTGYTFLGFALSAQSDICPQEDSESPVD